MKSLFERAAILPGRSLTRSKKVFGRWAERGEGAEIIDTDGHRYIDMLCALGAVSLGYPHNREWCDSVETGVYSLPHRVEVEAAEAVLTHVAPWASSVRFVKTGSEATHAAYRIAKKATERPIVLIAEDAYHGWHEWCAGDDLNVLRYPHRMNAWFDDIDTDVAAVFVEPHRWVLEGEREWIVAIKRECEKTGALLVFDSMIYGGRFALGGASEYFGIVPDLECFGKALGNGQSVAFVVGRDALAEHGEIVSGTYSGDVGGLAAVVDTIRTYTSEPVIETLWARGRQLQEGLRRLVPAELGVCEGAPVHQRIRFVNEAHGLQFAEAMWARGVLWHPGCTNIMYAHTEAQIAQVIAAADESIRCL